MTLELLDGRAVHTINGVISFVGEDAQGQFGLLPRHEAVLTVLAPGLFRYRLGNIESAWLFGASLGGLLRSDAGSPNARSTGCRLQIVSQRFLLDGTPEQLVDQLSKLRTREIRQQQLARSAVEQMDRALYQRLQELTEGSTR